jgi:hypothetical protein
MIPAIEGLNINEKRSFIYIIVALNKVSESDESVVNQHIYGALNLCEIFNKKELTLRR